MAQAVTYRLEDSVATITLDDGKVNALSPERFSELGSALDRAAADRVPVVLSGRQGAFSAGFDLRVLRAGGSDALKMVRSGFELAERVLSFPRPVIALCTGHAVAMGVFLLLSADYRIGVASGAHKIVANEVAIGLTMPRAAVEICRYRLTPAHFNRAVILAESYTHDEAVAAGFLDRVVPESELGAAAQSLASQLGKLDFDAHAATKLRVRQPLLSALSAAIEADHAGLSGRA